jgi:NADH dehydrogenase FAD-containing subunit
MLPEFISGSIGLTNAVSPIRRLCARTNLIMREIEGIDLQKQIVSVPAPAPASSSFDTIIW